MTPIAMHSDTEVLRTAAHAITGPADYEELVQLAALAQCVLIGEASHGTREFYEVRADLTRRLIDEHGFRAVAIEADWPDTARAHRYAIGCGEDSSADEALSSFRRFPAWMWRNTVMVDFLDWMRNWNESHPDEAPAGIYGLDLYSLHGSIEAVLEYLDKVDARAAERARKRYGCFEHFGEDPQFYGHATVQFGVETCEDAVVAQLVELRRKPAQWMRQDGRLAEEEFFSAEQNARLVMNAERYYRAMFHGRDESWNLRDTHMFETLKELMAHVSGIGAKVVVWAHNSHLGDARATEMSRRGELNLGQLVRQQFGGTMMNIGFSTYSGTVTAASNWGAAAERKQVRPGMAGSYEALFHEAGVPAFWLNLRAPTRALRLLREPRLQRAIGVIYRPDTERWSHYFRTTLPEQFDAIIHLDETRALEPLERNSEWDSGELPETYPSAL
jgi:erythromycin esterase-like protein